jgi:hypothetical protein
MSEPLEPDEGSPVMGWEPGKVREADASDVAIRLAFGAAISVVAAIVTNVFGAAAGGMFLAFPAILPATLTLLEKEEGTEDAVHDQRGAVLGALGMIAFGFTAALSFDRLPIPAVVALASVAWAVVAVGAYLAVTAWRRRAGS